jgi:hypothetical protein
MPARKKAAKKTAKKTAKKAAKKAMPIAVGVADVAADPKIVERDVQRAMRFVVGKKTPFEGHRYSLDLKPRADYPDGWAATLSNWKMILHMVAERLADPLEGGYQVVITEQDALKTLGTTLLEACDLLISKIIPFQP